MYHPFSILKIIEGKCFTRDSRLLRCSKIDAIQLISTAKIQYYVLQGETMSMKNGQAIYTTK